jgi:hypothetical protein
MAYNHGLAARFYWHTRDMSPYVEGVDLGLTRGLAEHRPLSGTAVTRLAGFEDGSITLTGAAWEAATSDAHAYNRFHESSSRPFAFLPAGDAVGSVAYCGVSNENSMGVVAGDDIVRLPVGLVTSDVIERGAVLHALGSAASSPGSSVNNGGPTTGALAAYMICTAITGGQTLNIVVENSADNSSWAEVGGGELTQAVTAASSTFTVTGSGTISQYLRVTWSLTGGSATWFIAVARR